MTEKTQSELPDTRFLRLSRCTQQVFYAGGLSVIMSLAFGVPYGSVLGPLLFLLYTAELFIIVVSTDLTSRDMQLYVYQCPGGFRINHIQYNVSFLAWNELMEISRIEPISVLTGPDVD